VNGQPSKTGRRAWPAVVLLAVVLILVVVISTLEQQAQPHVPSGPESFIVGTVTALPVCPVESSPVSSACAPRPVGGAVITVSTPDQGEWARATTDPDGSYSITLHGYGTVTVTALSVEGLLRAPAPLTVSIDSYETRRVNLQYDTGIR
jgi:Carboxypeptidase regulatory-like domain